MTCSTPYRIPPEDLRFNKFNMDMYMGKKEYEMIQSESDSYLDSLLRNSNAASVVTKHDFGLVHDYERIMNEFGGPPSQPMSLLSSSLSSSDSDDSQSDFWEQMRRVLRVHKYRIKGKDPRVVMPLPFLWKHYDMEKCAKAVHNEYPGLHQSELLVDFADKPEFYGPIQFDSYVLNARSGSRFLNGILCLAEANTYFISFVGPHNFCAKWAFGRARPEEVCWSIKHDCVDTTHIPIDIIHYCKDLPISNPEDFTSYSEGCPLHPSYPAMHSASSALSIWAAVLLNLTPVQWCQAKIMDYAVAFSRTIAGVHYEDDNIMGLNLGQELVALELPHYLEQRYGADRDRVEEKVKRVRFDWREFDPQDPCPELGYDHEKYYYDSTLLKKKQKKQKKKQKRRKKN